MTDVDLCVCCGVPVPEGRMVCAACESGEQTPKEEMEVFLEKLLKSLVQENDN